MPPHPTPPPTVVLPGAWLLVAAQARLAASNTGKAIAVAQAHDAQVPEDVRAAERALRCWAHHLERPGARP